MSALEQDAETGVSLWKPLLRKNLEPLLPYLEHEGLVDLSINKPGEVILKTDKGKTFVKDPKLTLKSLHEMAGILATYTEQDFNMDNPRLSCVLPYPYGFRVQVNAFDNVESGIAISIRAGVAKCFPLESYFSAEECALLRDAIEKKKNIFVTGATGSGKTTLCNSLIREIPKDDRIITLEDPAELIVPHKDAVRFTISSYGTTMSKMNFSDVAMDIMRHSPDRFIVGEIRKINVMTFLELLNTGHGGTLATFHANSAEKAFDRIISMASGIKDGNMTFTQEYVREQLDEIALVIQMTTSTDSDGVVHRDTPKILWIESVK